MSGHPLEMEWDEEYWRVVMEQGEAVNVDVWRTDAPAAGWDEEPLNAEEAENVTEATTDPPPAAVSSVTAENIWQIAADYMREKRVIQLPAIGYNRGGLLVQWGNKQAFVPASHLIGMPRSAELDERNAYLAGRVGTHLNLCVIEVDPTRDRLVLSEREAAGPAGQTARDAPALAPGARCRGIVTAVRDFGIFVQVGELEGLVHISELSWSRVRHPGDLFQVGQEVEVLVLSVDMPARRLALSVKQLLPDPWQEVGRRYQIGQMVRGIVTSVTDFGAFVEIEKGIEGLIHVSELAEGALLHPRSVIWEGKEVWARIVSLDPTNHRMGLSMRQISGGEAAGPWAGIPSDTA